MRKDRRQQVKTTKLKHGKYWYAEIGAKGGEKSPSKFTSESGKAAITKRWENHRKKQNESTT